MSTSKPPKLASLKGRMGAVPAALVGISNQVVTSGTNFVLGIFMLRTLEFAEFGLYGTLFAASLVAGGIVISLFLGQMTVLFPDYEATSVDRFCGSVLTMVGSITLATLVISGLLIALGAAAGLAEQSWNAAAFLAFTGTFILKEYFVRAAYCYHRETRALRLNLVLATTLAAMLAAAYFGGMALSASAILAFYAASCLLAAVWGYAELRLPLIRDRQALAAIWSDLWLGGKWAVSADLVNSLRQQSHIMLTAAVVGPVGVALINAAKLFVTPITIITPAISQIFVARIVRLRASAPLKLIRRGVQFAFVTAAMVVAYGLVLALVFDAIEELVVGAGKPDLWPMVFAWLVVSTLTALLHGLQMTQKSLKRFKALLMTSLPMSILGVGCIYILLLAFGPLGAVYGLGLAQLLFIALLAIMIRNYVREIRASQAGALPQ